LIFPCALASTTVPTTLAPAGITVTPWAWMGAATVALNVWPGWLTLEPSSCCVVTAICVPAGITIGGGGGGGGGVAAAVGAGAGAAAGAALCEGGGVAAVPVEGEVAGACSGCAVLGFSALLGCWFCLLHPPASNKKLSASGRRDVVTSFSLIEPSMNAVSVEPYYTITRWVQHRQTHSEPIACASGL
jgi:hypothetical protein